MCRIKLDDRANSICPELVAMWPELCSIFEDYNKCSEKVLNKIRSLGIEAEKCGSGHMKLTFTVRGRNANIICSATPSDSQVGRQILRQIRRLYMSDVY